MAALAHVTADQSINPEGIEEADVFAAAQEGGQTCIQVFFFRTGQNWGNRAYFPKADRSLPVEEVLDSFIAQFYDDKPVPRLILLSHDVPNRELLAEALCIKADRKVEIRVPQRGAKTGIVEHALEQRARGAGPQAGGRILAAAPAGRPRRALRADGGAAPHRGVRQQPHPGLERRWRDDRRGRDGFVKGQYRKFNIKSENLTPGDDYAMMREVLTRRFKRLQWIETKSRRGREERGAGSSALGVIEGRDGAKQLVAMAAASIEEAAPSNCGRHGCRRRGRCGERRERRGRTTTLPDRPDLVLIDGGAGQLAVAPR